MNEDNLIPLDKRTTSEQREIAKKGGKASGKSRLEKRTFRRLMEIALSAKMKYEATGEELTRKEVAAMKIAEQCSDGDLKAIQLAADLLGERVIQSDVTAKVVSTHKVDMSRLTPEQREVLLSIGTDIINREA